MFSFIGTLACTCDIILCSSLQIDCVSHGGSGSLPRVAVTRSPHRSEPDRRKSLSSPALQTTFCITFAVASSSWQHQRKPQAVQRSRMKERLKKGQKEAPRQRNQVILDFCRCMYSLNMLYKAKYFAVAVFPILPWIQFNTYWLFPMRRSTMRLQLKTIQWLSHIISYQTCWPID